MRKLLSALAIAIAMPLAASDSCDISLRPAATLLLPYFEVDITSPQSTAVTTLFSITNTSPQAQIARVTVWTDRAYPVLTFNVSLTGYDVQSINLYDVIHSGTIPATCSNAPASVPAADLADLQHALTTGTVSPSCAVGESHAHAIGYVTIDLVANCGTKAPTDRTYFDDILFDNVLTGDYQQINPNPATGNYAGGNPLVHIRAVDGALPYTFYDLYTNAAGVRGKDRRQPLPSVFMSRYINGGTGLFNTQLKMWREPLAMGTTCAAFQPNARIPWIDDVRFDEHENIGYVGTSIGGPYVAPATPVTISASTYLTSLFPGNDFNNYPYDLGGWLYLNLDTFQGDRPRQGWVVTTMSAEGRYSVDMDAIALGNGCSPRAGRTWVNPIAPAPTIDDSCDIATRPAATLLLPYFEVDVNSPKTTARTTLFTITNTSPMPQIARVTLWTDWSYPMFTFNVFLTGYDVQGINLYDVLQRGVIAPSDYFPTQGGTSNTTPPGERSIPNDANPNFSQDAATTCANLPGLLSAEQKTELLFAFLTGKLLIPPCGYGRVGDPHNNAIGYATIDVVANCNSTSPFQPSYFTRELLYDNVLTGDYQQIDPNPRTGNYAGGNPLVHIRAIPEAGPAGAVVAADFPYTFYDRYGTGKRDRRQPLPSQFVSRFIQGGAGSFETNLQIWREGMSTPNLCPFDALQSSAMPVAGVVRFDEHENATMLPLSASVLLPATSAPGSDASLFPPLSTSGDLGGFFVLNLDNGGTRRPSQNWVVTSMFAEGRYSVAFDATPLANGCNP